MDAKYSGEIEAEQRVWISKNAGVPVEGDFHESLKNGVTLLK